MMFAEITLKTSDSAVNLFYDGPGTGTVGRLLGWRSGGHGRKPWENHAKTMGKCGETIGKPWENAGKPWEKHKKNMGKLMFSSG